MTLAHGDDCLNVMISTVRALAECLIFTHYIILNTDLRAAASCP